MLVYFEKEQYILTGCTTTGTSQIHKFSKKKFTSAKNQIFSKVVV